MWLNLVSQLLSLWQLPAKILRIRRVGTKSIKGSRQSIHARCVCVCVCNSLGPARGYARLAGAPGQALSLCVLCECVWRQINQKTRLKRTTKSALSYAQFNLSDNFCSCLSLSLSHSLAVSVYLPPCCSLAQLS